MIAVDENRFQIREVNPGEYIGAMNLAWDTFSKFDARDYSQEGIDAFRDFISDGNLYEMFLRGAYLIYVAVDSNDKLAGVISIRGGNHISLLFVAEKYQKMGVATKLIDHVKNKLKEEYKNITVNAAPYAVGFYHRYGFIDTGLEQEQTGIKYTPMEYLL